MEVLQLLPHEIIPIAYLPQVFATQERSTRTTGEPEHKVYVTQVSTSDVFEHCSGSVKFDRYDFRTHPCHYRSLFASRVAPYVHCIINAVYWDPRFPRLLTKEQMRKQVERGNDRYVFLKENIPCRQNFIVHLYLFYCLFSVCFYFQISRAMFMDRLNSWSVQQPSKNHFSIMIHSPAWKFLLK